MSDSIYDKTPLELWMRIVKLVDDTPSARDSEHIVMQIDLDMVRLRNAHAKGQKPTMEEWTSQSVAPTIDTHRLLEVTQQNENHIENLQEEIKRLDSRCNAILQQVYDNNEENRDARVFVNFAMHYIKRLFEDVSRLPKQRKREDDAD